MDPDNRLNLLNACDTFGCPSIFSENDRSSSSPEATRPSLDVFSAFGFGVGFGVGFGFGIRFGFRFGFGFDEGVCVCVCVCCVVGQQRRR